jgi:hypothetical protein
VAELVIEDIEVVDEDEKAVEPDSWEDREVWLIVWPKSGRLCKAFLV